MSITYVNTKSQTYYRPQGTTKTGKPKSNFLLRRTGKPAIAVPANFAIDEPRQAYVL